MHTGGPLAKDPAVAVILIQNEDGMLFGIVDPDRALPPSPCAAEQADGGGAEEGERAGFGAACTSPANGAALDCGGIEDQRRTRGDRQSRLRGKG